MIDEGAMGPPCPSGLCRLADAPGAIPGGTTDLCPDCDEDDYRACATCGGSQIVVPRLIVMPPAEQDSGAYDEEGIDEASGGKP